MRAWERMYSFYYFKKESAGLRIKWQIVICSIKGLKKLKYNRFAQCIELIGASLNKLHTYQKFCWQAMYGKLLYMTKCGLYN